MRELLRIRNAQMAILARTRASQFEDEMVVHLRGFAPKHCAVIGEENVRRAIGLGVERATRYGFTSYGPVRFYLEMMFLFGSHFDTDPQTTWASEVLRQGGLEPELARADRLHQRVTEYLRLVSGPDHVHIFQSLRYTRAAADRPLAFTSDDLEAGLLAEFGRAHPEKVTFLGKEPLRLLIRRGTEAAQAYDVHSARGIAVFCMIMFAAGHGFMDDPLLPWASQTLGAPERQRDGEQLADKLQARGVIYLDYVLAHFAEA